MKYFGYFILSVFGIILLTMIATGVNVISTPSRVLNKTLQTSNVIQSYEWYFDTKASYDARVSQIRQFEGWLSAETNPDEQRRLRTEVSAMQQSCREMSAIYTANSSKLNKQFFKSKELPFTLNAKDCEIS